MPLTDTDLLVKENLSNFIVQSMADRHDLIDKGQGFFNDCLDEAGTLNVIQPHGRYQLVASGTNPAQARTHPYASPIIFLSRYVLAVPRLGDVNQIYCHVRL